MPGEDTGFRKGGGGGEIRVTVVLKRGVFARTHAAFFPSLWSLGVPQKGRVLTPTPGSAPGLREDLAARRYLRLQYTGWPLLQVCLAAGIHIGLDIWLTT